MTNVINNRLFSRLFLWLVEVKWVDLVMSCFESEISMEGHGKQPDG